MLSVMTGVRVDLHVKCCDNWYAYMLSAVHETGQ